MAFRIPFLPLRSPRRRSLGGGGAAQPPGQRREFPARHRPLGGAQAQVQPRVQRRGSLVRAGERARLHRPVGRVHDFGELLVHFREAIRASQLIRRHRRVHQHLEVPDVFTHETRGLGRLVCGHDDAVQGLEPREPREHVRSVKREFSHRREFQRQRLQVRASSRQRVELRDVVYRVISRAQQSERGELR